MADRRWSACVNEDVQPRQAFRHWLPALQYHMVNTTYQDEAQDEVDKSSMTTRAHSFCSHFIIAATHNGLPSSGSFLYPYATNGLTMAAESYRYAPGEPTAVVNDKSRGPTGMIEARVYVVHTAADVGCSAVKRTRWFPIPRDRGHATHARTPLSNTPCDALTGAIAFAHGPWPRQRPSPRFASPSPPAPRPHAPPIFQNHGMLQKMTT